MAQSVSVVDILMSAYKGMYRVQSCNLTLYSRSGIHYQGTHEVDGFLKSIPTRETIFSLACIGSLEALVSVASSIHGVHVDRLR